MPEAPLAPRRAARGQPSSDRDEDDEADEDREGDHLAARHVERGQRERNPGLEGAEESGRRRMRAKKLIQTITNVASTTVM